MSKKGYLWSYASWVHFHSSSSGTLSHPSVVDSHCWSWHDFSFASSLHFRCVLLLQLFRCYCESCCDAGKWLYTHWNISGSSTQRLLLMLLSFCSCGICSWAEMRKQTTPCLFACICTTVDTHRHSHTPSTTVYTDFESLIKGAFPSVTMARACVFVCVREWVRERELIICIK